jgi:hypothetical protein
MTQEFSIIDLKDDRSGGQLTPAFKQHSGTLGRVAVIFALVAQAFINPVSPALGERVVQKMTGLSPEDML